MKVSDFIADFLIEKNINRCFSVTGGFAMHLNDSFGEKLDVVYTHGEQPAGYSALGWSSYEHNPSICCVTSGCGGTNAMTPCLIAYQDSVPVFFISGQVQHTNNIRKHGGKVLQECIHNLTTGRLGPVWLSVPVDIQSMQVPETIEEWIAPRDIHMTTLPEEFHDVWSKSKRPIILAGNGIHLSKTKEVFKLFLKYHNLPYVYLKVLPGTTEHYSRGKLK